MEGCDALMWCFCTLHKSANLEMPTSDKPSVLRRHRGSKIESSVGFLSFGYDVEFIDRKVTDIAICSILRAQAVLGRTLPILRLIRISSAEILGILRIRAHRALSQHLILQSIVPPCSRDNLVRSRAILCPRKQGQQCIMFRVSESRHAADTRGESCGLICACKVPRSLNVRWSSGTVLHSRHQKEAIPRIQLNAFGKHGSEHLPMVNH